MQNKVGFGRRENRSMECNSTAQLNRKRMAAGNFVDASVVPDTVDRFVVSVRCQSNTLHSSG